MKVITDEKFVARKAKIGRYSSLAGLAILTFGMFISFSHPELFDVSLLCLVLGFGVASLGSYNVSKWVKPPRGDEVFEKALKGLSNKYQLFNYILPMPHVLLTPFSVYVLHPKKQDGEIEYLGQDKWRQKKDFRRRLRLFFGGEQPLGNPSAELAADISTLQKYLARHLPDCDIPVRGVVVFLHPDVKLEIKSDDLPVLRPKDLKKFLADQQKIYPTIPAERLNKVAEALSAAKKH